MWPVIMAAMRTYAPYVVFPFAAAIGFIGYNIEGTISDRYTPWRGSVIERREQRLLVSKSLIVNKQLPYNVFT